MPDADTKTILIVDDEKRILSTLSRYLRSAGYKCHTADSADKALQTAAKHHVDILLTDVCMPGMNGIELVEQAVRWHPGIECMVMTGHPDKYTYVDIIRAGAKDFLLKPFSNEELLAKLERVRREHEATVSLLGTNERLARQARINQAHSELSRSLIKSMPIEDMSSLVLESAKNLTESDIGYLGFVDRETQQLQSYPGAWAMLEECMAGNSSPGFGHACAAWRAIVEEKQVLAINSLQGDPRFMALDREAPRIERLLAVPVIIGQEPKGMIALANSPRDYSEDDIQNLTDIAAIYSVAIKRRWDELDLEKANGNLAVLLDLYTNKFNAAGQLLKRSIDLIKGLHSS